MFMCSQFVIFFFKLCVIKWPNGLTFYNNDILTTYLLNIPNIDLNFYHCSEYNTLIFIWDLQSYKIFIGIGTC